MQDPRTRRVANLTQDQIAHKRAIDSSNQRYHRAKKKEHVRNLEAKVAELTYNLELAESRLRQYEERYGPDPASGLGSIETPPATLSDPEQQSQPSQILDCLDDGSWDSLFPQSPSQLSLSDVWNTIPLDFGSGIAVNLSDSCTFLDLGLQDVAFMDGTGAGAGMLDGFLPSSLPDVGLDSSPIPEWHLLPLHLAPTNKLDEMIITKSKEWRERFLNSDRHVGELEEAPFPSISSLLNQPSPAEATLRPVSDVVAAQVLLSPVKGLVQRIAFMYKLSYFIRWLVCQTEQTYNEMPEYMRPTELQRTVPHPAWVDMITYPDVRDAIISGKDWSLYEVFRTLTGLSTSVAWPYPDSDAFVDSLDGKSLRLNPVLELHIRDLKNWSCGKEAADAFPFMQPHYKA